MTDRSIRRSRLSYYLKFTFFFLMIELIMYAPFLVFRKGLVWEHDSYTQHVKAMIFISRWFRQAGKSLLRGRFAELATYSFSIGYGSDAMTTLAYYGVGDPFYVLSALVPTRYIYLYYIALIPVKNYLSGLAISSFLRRRWPEEAHSGGVLSGALIYTFCGFVLITCVGQPIFLNALIVYPLMLLGIEKVYDGQKPWLFILSVFLATVSNFYFIVSIVLMAVLYALFRYFPMPVSEIGKRFAQIGIMIAGGVVGVAAGGFLLLPMALTVLSNKRVDLDRTIGLFYDLRSCRLLPVGFLASNEVQYGSLCYAGLALICTILLLGARGRIKLKIQFVLYTFLLFVPAFGYLTNGLSYPINRWCWAYSALVACIVAEVWPQLFALTRRQKAGIAVCLTLYFFACNILDDRMELSFELPMVFAALTFIFILLSQWTENADSRFETAAFAAGAGNGTGAADTSASSGSAAFAAGAENGSGAADALASSGSAAFAAGAENGSGAAEHTADAEGTEGIEGAAGNKNSAGSSAGTASTMPHRVKAVERYDERKERRFRRAQTGIVLMTALSICINGVVINYPGTDGRIGVYKDLRALSSNTSGLGASPANDRNMWINDTAQVMSAAELSKKDFNRVSNTEPGYWYQNTSMLNGVSTTQSFWSINNPRVLEYLDALAVSDANNNAWQFTNLDNRAVLNELASVGYLYCMHPEKLPYGYSETSLDPKSANSTYQNTAPLALGYTYDSAISRAQFDALTPAQRQEVLLTHAVLDDPGALADRAPIEQIRDGLTCKEIPFTAKCLDWGVTQSDENTFAVTSDGARVQLTFDELSAGECYLYMKNIQFTKANYVDLYLGDDSFDPLGQYTPEAWDALSYYERYCIRKEIYDALPLNNIKIGAAFGNSKNGDLPVTENEVNYILPDNYQFYSGRQDFLLNSYALREGINTITITFPEKGIYHFDELRVISEPLTGYDEAVAARSAESLTSLDIHQNENSFTTKRVDGEITVTGDKLLCLTIPYSEGWTAYVDGEKASLEPVNIMFTGLRLTNGHHTVELRYETPGLRIGLLLTAAGVFLFLLWVVLSAVLGRRRRKTEAAS